MTPMTPMTPKERTRRQVQLTDAHHDFQKGMTSHANFKLNNRETSDDVVQDTFMKTWKYLAREGKIDAMKAFLYHVLNQLIVDEYRKRKSISLDVLLEKGLDPAFNAIDSITDAFDGKVLFKTMDRLPEKYRKVLRMRYAQDLSLAEMAILTGQSKNTMAVQVHRGLALLRTLAAKQ